MLCASRLAREKEPPAGQAEETRYLTLKKEKDFFVSPQKGMFKLFLKAGCKQPVVDLLKIKIGRSGKENFRDRPVKLDFFTD